MALAPEKKQGAGSPLTNNQVSNRPCPLPDPDEIRADIIGSRSSGAHGTFRPDPRNTPSAFIMG